MWFTRWKMLACLSLFSLPLFSETSQRWVVYYSNTAPIEAFDPYQLTVFDSHNHPHLSPLNKRGKTALGYISLGEVSPSYDYFEAMKEEGILLQENNVWRGNRMVDLRDPRWTKRVVEQLVPHILNERFDGIFIDTIDNAAFLEQQNPMKNKGMKQAAIDLIRSIRHHFPHITIMMNRGYDILSDLADDIDIVLGESVYSTFDFNTRTYKYVPKQDYFQQKKMFAKIKKTHPKLEIFTLDYWNPEDPATIQKIYKVQRKNGFVPYVSTISLQEVIPEPT